MYYPLGDNASNKKKRKRDNLGYDDDSSDDGENLMKCTKKTLVTRYKRMAASLKQHQKFNEELRGLNEQLRLEAGLMLQEEMDETNAALKLQLQQANAANAQLEEQLAEATARLEAEEDNRQREFCSQQIKPQTDSSLQKRYQRLGQHLKDIKLELDEREILQLKDAFVERTKQFYRIEGINVHGVGTQTITVDSRAKGLKTAMGCYTNALVKTPRHTFIVRYSSKMFGPHITKLEQRVDNRAMAQPGMLFSYKIDLTAYGDKYDVCLDDDGDSGADPKI